MTAITVRKNKRGTSSRAGGHGVKRARTPTLRRGNIVTIPRSSRFGLGPFPSKRQATFKYAELLDFTLTSGKGSYQYSCNGMYDPNITGVGHQPMYFDEVMAVYNHYTVISSKIKITPAVSSLPIFVSILIDDDTTPALPNTTTALERPGVVTKYCSQGVNTSPPLYKTWNARSVFPGDPLNNNNLRGTAAANPAEQSYYTMFVSDPTLASSTHSFIVEVEYTAVMHELKSMAQS